MPLLYSDSSGWILWQVQNGVRMDTIYATDVPESVRNSVGRATGHIGGATPEIATREANWWRETNPDLFREVSASHTWCLYNYDTGQQLPVFNTPPREYTPEELARKKQMIKLKFRRDSGKLVLEVDAGQLHETLDAIGCRTQVSGGVTRYEGRPAANSQVADTNAHTLSTEIFLVKSDSPKVYDLSAVYTRPPSLENLRKLADSANEKCRAILEHYQPIDIQVNIQKKLIS